MGEAARLKPLEVELKRLEDLSEAIVQDFAYMRQREEEMRDTNGKYCLILLDTTRFYEFSKKILLCRVYQFQSVVFQCLQHAVSGCLGYMAGAVPASLFQSQKINRIKLFQ